MYQELEQILGQQGVLAKAWPGYEARPGQLIMAREVARAFLDDDFAVIEAGTGTGKTLAYLLPALLSGKKTIISTGLKNLQDQIFEKDIPFIEKYIGGGFKAARLKGRENYLCRHYLNQALAQGQLFPGEDYALLKDILAWSQTSRTGDRAELPELAEGGPLWAEVSAPSERCLGQRCRFFSECFLWQARKEAASADLVLVNHHLFMADLAVRGRGFGEVIPEWDAAIFDEAHLMEDAATSYFGKSVSTGALAAFKRDLDKALAMSSRDASLTAAAAVWGRQADALGLHFYKNISEVELWQEGDREAGPLADFLTAFYHDSLALKNRITPRDKEDEEMVNLAKRLDEIAHNLLFIAEASDHSYVYQAERQGRRLTLSAYPVKISGHLTANLIDTGRTLVFTSATLSSGGDFSFFKQRLGLWPEIEGLSVDSPFNYEGNTMTYIAAHLPPPGSPALPEALTAEIERLITISRGRALVLFTSYRMLDYVSSRLKGRLPWPVLTQGDLSRHRILETFKKDTHSILMATHSFWQGVDVTGESLSMLIVEKLPFPRPDRPLVKARCHLMEEDGHDSFMDYYIPEAVVALKQGLGRLIRSAEDQGVMAILDSRLLSKGYGKKILKSTLPVNKKTSDLKEVEAFFRDKNI